MALNTDHIKWFRDSSPYIDAHRDKTFVVCIASDALHPDRFHGIGCIADNNQVTIAFIAQPRTGRFSVE